MLYNNIGRLASLVYSPCQYLEEPRSTIVNKRVLWYGSVSDIFSMSNFRKFEVVDFGLSTLLDKKTPFFKEHNQVHFFKNEKKRKQILDKYDIVFFPRTSTEAAEIRRVEK